MGGSSKTTILDRLQEMVSGRGSATNDRPEPGGRKAERGQSKIARKGGKKRKRAASVS